MNTKTINFGPIPISPEAVHLLKVLHDLTQALASADFTGNTLSDRESKRIAMLMAEIPEHTLTPGCPVCQVMDLIGGIIEKIDGSTPDIDSANLN